MTRPVKVGLLVGSGAAGLVLVYMAAMLVYLDIEMRELFESEEVVAVPFDPDGWARQGASHDGTREAMVADLLAAHAFAGMSDDSVVELLGRPDSAGWAPSSIIIYRLGPEPGPFSVDDEWLVFYLEDERVTRVSVERD